MMEFSNISCINGSSQDSLSQIGIVFYDILGDVEPVQIRFTIEFKMNDPGQGLIWSPDQIWYPD